MQKLYTDTDMNESFDKHPVIAQIDRVESAFDSINRPVDLLSIVTPEKGTKPDSCGLFITPDFSEDLEKDLDQIGWLSTHEDVKETFSETSGSTELTNIVVRNDLTVQEVVEKLAKTNYEPDNENEDADMITKVIHLVEFLGNEKDRKYEPVQIVAYDILRKSLGWEAERLLSETDDFHKALASMDDMGIDLGTNNASPWDCGDEEGFQLKTMQRVTSQSLHTEEHQIPHLSYAWTKNGILVSDMDERAGSDGQAKEVAKEAGTTMTVVKKSLQSGPLSDYPRPGRVIAWE